MRRLRVIIVAIMASMMLQSCEKEGNVISDECVWVESISNSIYASISIVTMTDNLGERFYYVVSTFQLIASNVNVGDMFCDNQYNLDMGLGYTEEEWEALHL